MLVIGIVVISANIKQKTPTTYDYISKIISQQKPSSDIVVINVNITEKRKDFLKQHEKKHLPAHAVQWYSCDKCSFKTKDKTYIEEHKTIHLSADAINSVPIKLELRFVRLFFFELFGAVIPGVEGVIHYYHLLPTTQLPKPSVLSR
jgi:hypothetical protein